MTWEPRNRCDDNDDDEVLSSDDENETSSASSKPGIAQRNANQTTAVPSLRQHQISEASSKDSQMDSDKGKHNKLTTWITYFKALLRCRGSSLVRYRLNDAFGF